MSTDTEIKQLKKEEQQTTQTTAWCCCLPVDAAGNPFWGFIFVVVGGVWLLSNLGVAAVGLNLIGALFVITLGLFWLVKAPQRRS